MLTLSLFRVGIILWQWERVIETQGIGFVLLQGVRFDIITLTALLVIPLVLTPIITISKKLYKHWYSLLRFYLSATILFIVFMELSTPNFLIQFDLRPNILFVEYLKYPKEVFSMLWTGYKPSIILATLIIPLVAIGFYRGIPTYKEKSLRCHQAIIMSVTLLVICLISGRSSLGHRPANPSIIAFSSDLMVNDIALNSSYSLLYAIYESFGDETGGISYGEMAHDEILRHVKDNMFVSEGDFISNKIPTLHNQKATNILTKPKNIVIILEESMGAEYVGRLGGIGVTPNLDELASQGIWFEKLYATGTRSVRGIEAVITGFTPSPARSVVKLSKSQRDFFTFAEVLRRQNYDTSFIYGGEAHFDNMKRFFVNNGFNRIIEQKDYTNPLFSGSWGVSDEDLFNKAHHVFEKQGNKPFFSLVFTSSNHTPFEFPDGKIELHDTEKNTENNAVKYADYSLGEFIKKAKKSSYWDSTLFLIVADHNSRVRGANLVPIERFHIPGLILGGSVTSDVISRISSQIDLMPTLLSMAGISSVHPAIGYDLTQTKKISKTPGRAIMQYNSTQAYMEEDQVIIFERNKQPTHYQYNNGNYIKHEQQNTDLITKALAHSLFTPLAYTNGLYKLPD
tara:strand:- start:45068 stop:46942 length:1875 start_codon:yes stop_codon:yes gene_type:complete